MVDKELVSRKLARLGTYADELRQAGDINWEKYRSDVRSKAFVVRYIHLAIEEIIDIANHFVAFHHWREPTSFRDLFTIMREHEVIPENHLPTFQTMASFRNMLLHRYESTDDEVVFGIFKRRLDDFDLFIRLVIAWIDEHP